MLHSWMILLATALLSFGLRAQAPAAPSLNDLLDHVAARAQQDDAAEQAGHELVADELLTVDYLKDDGSIKEHNVYVRQPVVIGGRVFMRTVSHNGQPLSGKYIAKEKERESKFRDALAKNKATATRRDQDENLKIDRDLFSRFLLSMEGEETVNGRPAWIVQFHPKPGDKPERSRAERVVNHMAGKLWIDQKDYEIARADMALTEPVTFYGVIANIRALHLKLEQIEKDGLWLPSYTDLQLEGRAILTSLHQHSLSEFSNFRLQSDLGANGS